MNNATAQSQESPLVIFGGLVAEINPTELPPGSAAIACDVDFTVGSVKTRYGIENVYAYDGSDEILEVGAGVDVAVAGGVAWANPSHIQLDAPPSYASVTLNAVPVAPALNNIVNVGSGGNVTSVTGTVTAAGSAIQIGDMALVIVNLQPFSGSTPVTVSSFTDTLGNVWTPLAPPQTFTSFFTGKPCTFVIYKATMGTAVPVSSSFSFMVGFSQAANPNSIAFANIAGLASVDQIQQTAGTSVTPTAGPMTIAESEFLISFMSTDAAATVPSAPWISTEASIAWGGGGALSAQGVWQQATAGTYSAVWGVALGNYASTFVGFKLGTSPVASFSDILSASGYGFSIPSSSQILGVEVQVKGFQTSSDPSSILTMTPIVGGGPSITLQLPSVQGTVPIGGPNELLGMTLTPAIVNGGGFGFEFVATDGTGLGSTFKLSAALITVWYTPPGSKNFTWVSTFGRTDGGIFTLALDDGGVLWQEDVLNNPDVLVPIYTAIEPNTFAKGTEIDDREFIALSDLVQGTDMPRQWNGDWLDRVSKSGRACRLPSRRHRRPTTSSTSRSRVRLRIPAPVFRSERCSGPRGLG